MGSDLKRVTAKGAGLKLAHPAILDVRRTLALRCHRLYEAAAQTQDALASLLGGRRRNAPPARWWTVAAAMSGIAAKLNPSNRMLSFRK